jgi:uncharacterized protein (TIGR02996 family)
VPSHARWRAWISGRSSTPGSRRSSSLSSDEELAAAIRATPDDPAPYLVYADWLSDRGDPRGQLITIDHQLELTPTPELFRARREWLRAHPELVGIIEDWAQAVWKYGFVSKLVFEAGYYDRQRTDLDVAAIVQEILQHPSCRFVRSVELGELWGGVRLKTVVLPRE